jgi:hypothetical protein
MATFNVSAFEGEKFLSDAPRTVEDFAEATYWLAQDLLSTSSQELTVSVLRDWLSKYAAGERPKVSDKHDGKYRYVFEYDPS